MAGKYGGAIVADVLLEHGARFLFTLCGGHISPILVESKRRGIRVVDMRDEANAVFAADAVARMTGGVGVAAVTAGPGVSNSITALKNAQMAQSPVLLLGGATATLLKGRGSLQDIDQLSLVRSCTKWAVSVRSIAELKPLLERALKVAQEGVPGPVFVELPLDLLYEESYIRELYYKETGTRTPKGLTGKALRLYLDGHLYRQFQGPRLPRLSQPRLKVPSLGEVAASLPLLAKNAAPLLEQTSRALGEATRPVLLVGNQAMVNCTEPSLLADAVRRLGLPTFLAGAARGLLGRNDPLQLRHHRGKALAEADLVLVAGFPFDFRMGYGRGISKKAKLVAANLSEVELRKNRRPQVAIKLHPGSFLTELARRAPPGKGRYAEWMQTLLEREAARDAEIAKQASHSNGEINAVGFFRRLEEKLSEDAVLVVDGGDFVATGSYVLRPRAPLSWLDPGVFGTLGVGGGFAAGASLVRPGKEVWLLYGDGSAAYSLSEFDTFCRHGLSPIAIIGNDGAWSQIAREQVEMLGDDVGTTLPQLPYHLVAEGYGGAGLLLTEPSKIDSTLDEAKRLSRTGRPVCINVHIARSSFRKGSISI